MLTFSYIYIYIYTYVYTVTYICAITYFSRTNDMQTKITTYILSFFLFNSISTFVVYLMLKSSL